VRRDGSSQCPSIGRAKKERRKGRETGEERTALNMEVNKGTQACGQLPFPLSALFSFRLEKCSPFRSAFVLVCEAGLLWSLWLTSVCIFSLLRFILFLFFLVQGLGLGGKGGNQDTQDCAGKGMNEKTGRKKEGWNGVIEK